MFKSRGLEIEVQAAAGMMLVQIGRKLVAELQGAVSIAGTLHDPMFFGVLTLSTAYG